MNQADTVKTVLTCAGWSESTRTHTSVTSGFRVYEHTGKTRVEYILGSRTERTKTIKELREILEEQTTEIERELSRQGFQVIMFVPDNGIRHFQLTIS